MLKKIIGSKKVRCRFEFQIALVGVENVPLSPNSEAIVSWNRGSKGQQVTAPVTATKNIEFEPPFPFQIITGLEGSEYQDPIVFSSKHILFCVKASKKDKSAAKCKVNVADFVMYPREGTINLPMEIHSSKSTTNPPILRVCWAPLFFIA